jgi:hypothetical protein
LNAALRQPVPDLVDLSPARQVVAAAVGNESDDTVFDPHFPGSCNALASQEAGVMEFPASVIVREVDLALVVHHEDGSSATICKGGPGSSGVKRAAARIEDDAVFNANEVLLSTGIAC